MVMSPEHPWVEQYQKGTIVICCGQGAWEAEAKTDSMLLKERFPYFIHKIVEQQLQHFKGNAWILFENMIQYNSINIVGGILSSLIVDQLKKCHDPCKCKGVALLSAYMKYSNILSSLTFFLNSFHFPFCYELIVRFESAGFMEIIPGSKD